MNYKKMIKAATVCMLTACLFSVTYSVKAQQSVYRAENQRSAEFQYTTTDLGYAVIDKYLGSESVLCIPESIIDNGKKYIVAELGSKLLIDNTTVKTVKLPKTVGNISTALTASTVLETILVAEDNPYFESSDGVLYRTFGKDYAILHSYPQAKKGEDFVLPYGVDNINTNAFSRTKELKRIILSEEIDKVARWSFSELMNPVSIYVKGRESISDMFYDESFYELEQGSKLIVKTNAQKTELNKNHTFKNVEVVSLEEDESYRIPCSSLTFNDNTMKKNITLNAGESYTLKDKFSMLPANTSDGVTWKSSNSKVATIANSGSEVHRIITTELGGTCTITGTDESGHKLEVNVTSMVPLSEEQFYLGVDDIEREKFIIGHGSSVDITASLPSNCQSLYSSAVWTVDNTNVIQMVESSNKDFVTVHGKNLGEAVITLTLKQGTKTYKRNITLVVRGTSNTLIVDAINDQYYTGQAIMPPVVVRSGNSILREGIDYTVRYENNIKKGMATVIVTGRGYYTGEFYSYFWIIENPTATPPVKVKQNQSITGTTSFKKVYGNGRFNLGAKAKTKLSYKSLNNNIAKVDANGNITIVGTGSVKIELTAAATGDYNKATKTITITVAPKQVSGLKVQSNKTNQISLTWNRDTKASGYKVYRYNTKTKRYDVIKTMNGNATNKFTDTKLAKGTAYQYKVAAFTSGLQGSQSANLVATTKLDTVNVKKVSAGKKQATVSWNKVSGVTGYEVLMATSKNGSYKKVGTVKKDKTVSFTQKNLKTKSTCYYKVRAYKIVKVNGKNVTMYGDVSAVKSVKIK